MYFQSEVAIDYPNVFVAFDRIKMKNGFDIALKIMYRVVNVIKIYLL